MTMESVEVIQADRDAAEAMWLAIYPFRGGEAAVMSKGAGDDGPVVQALARHRIASSTVVPGDVVALAAKALAKFADSHMRTPGSAEHWEDRLEHNREYFLSAAKAALSVLPIPDRREDELTRGKDELRRLMDTIWRSEYRTEAPNWQPLDELPGMVSQIDNMYAGVRSQRDKARAERGQIMRWLEGVLTMDGCCSATLRQCVDAIERGDHLALSKDNGDHG